LPFDAKGARRTHDTQKFGGRSSSQWIAIANSRASSPLPYLFALWRSPAGEENRENRKKTDQKRIPYRRNPRPRNQKQNVGIPKRQRPAYRGPKHGVIR